MGSVSSDNYKFLWRQLELTPGGHGDAATVSKFAGPSARALAEGGAEVGGTGRGPDRNQGAACCADAADAECRRWA